MFADALFVFFEVCFVLGLAVLALWALAKAAGYVAALAEGEPLLPTIRRDVQITRRDLRRTLRRPHPVA